MTQKLVPIVASLLAASAAQAANINLNFNSGGVASQTVAAGESTKTALGTTTESWNNLSGATGTVSAGGAVDSTGATLGGFTAAWNAPGLFTSTTDSTDANGNDFMKGYLDQTSSAIQSITLNLSGITYSSYDIYVYSASGSIPKSGYAKLWNGTISAPASFGEITSGTQIGSTFYQNYTSLSDGNSFVQITSVTAGSGTNGNYYKFSVTGTGAVTLQLTPDSAVSFNRTPLEAIQIVDTTAVPEPSTYGLMGAGALAAVALVRRRRVAGTRA